MKVIKAIKGTILLYNTLIVFAFLTVGVMTGSINGKILPIILILPIGLFYAMSLADLITNLSSHFTSLKANILKKCIYLYSFVVATLLVIAVLTTASNAAEMGVVVLLLPLAGYFIVSHLSKPHPKNKSHYLSGMFGQNTTPVKPKAKLKNHPKNETISDKLLSISITDQDPQNPHVVPTDEKSYQAEELTEITDAESEEFGIKDMDRRKFLKLLGGTSMGMFIMAMFVPKNASAAFFGSVPGPGTVSLKDTSGNQIDPAIKAPTDGYNITEIDDSGSPAYYGFVDKDGNWYITEEVSGTYLYFKGSTNFSASWTGRAGLSYNYFDLIF